MEDDAIIGALLGQRHDLRHVVRRRVLEEVDDDGALRFAGDVDLKACGEGGGAREGDQDGEFTHCRSPR